MKLRIRSMATKETIRITAPDTASLLDLETLISASLATTSSNRNPISPHSIHLSLNQTDELVAPSVSDPLSALGLTSGDLVFFSFSPFPKTLANGNPSQSPNVASPASGVGSSSKDLIESTNMEITVNPSPINQSADPMEVEAGPAVREASNKKHLIPSFVMELMDTESKDDAGILGRVIILTHAAFLDMNFTLLNGSGVNLPQGWASQASSSLCLEYTITDFVDQFHTINEKVVVLKLSVMGNWVTIYGYLGGESGKGDSYRFCFNLAKVVTLLSLDLNSMSKPEQMELMELFRGVKDGVSLPLMIDLCIKNSLPLPPCFMILSMDMKARILDLLPGADVVRVGSTCKEMQSLSIDENLWRQKMEKEFSNSLNDNSVMSAGTWRERYKRVFIARKNASRFRQRPINWRPFRGVGRPIGSGQRFIIGGDYDRFPVFGAGLNEPGPSVVPRQGPGGRQVPRCDFGGYSVLF